MPSQNKARNRANRGFTLLVALGVVIVVTMAVMLSYRVVGREADTQADTRRQKEAFFAAEAGLAEGREAVRRRAPGEGTQPYSDLLTGLHASGAEVTEEGLKNANPPWMELLPSDAPGDPWNYLRLDPGQFSTAEKTNGDGVPYLDYPEQRNVRYRVFIRDDLDDDDPQSDSNAALWVAAIGEVMNSEGRPTRSIVQALIRNHSGALVVTPGCPQGGCGSDNTYNNNGPSSSTPDITLPRP
ncbi:pilus assembly PilX family protein [Myxococcus landrumensis]|uniref:Type 4 fimbrial biogenesis protein PilX N-terminal domain-containing protein n=1 Tax=Myxococcus landrumensis TaxID=2813577 RepID=A0ABX7MYU8_9BACT|nr:hypothetical protein [Myxococcus landrumus]QSQ11594.1 hypothetical protein JY572_24735 [Myxococcus landrumus]